MDKTEQAFLKRLPARAEQGRILCQFSCGAASAVATKLTLAKYPRERVVIVNAFIAEEHADNRRFLNDCQVWFDHPITVLRDTKYGASTKEVWRKKRFMNSQHGAPCSKVLKRDLLDAFRSPEDIIVLGYTAEEVSRYERFFDPVSSHRPEVPLIDRGLMKADCLAIIERAGIELPFMYRAGFNNANCIGCVKGGEGYWNKIRQVFPVQFAEIADIQESIGPGAYLFRNRKTGERYSLRDLPPNRGRYEDEPAIACSFFCEAAEAEMEPNG